MNQIIKNKADIEIFVDSKTKPKNAKVILEIIAVDFDWGFLAIEMQYWDFGSDSSSGSRCVKNK